MSGGEVLIGLSNGKQKTRRWFLEKSLNYNFYTLKRHSPFTQKVSRFLSLPSPPPLTSCPIIQLSLSSQVQVLITCTPGILCTSDLILVVEIAWEKTTLCKPSLPAPFLPPYPIPPSLPHSSLPAPFLSVWSLVLSACLASQECVQ